MIACGTDATTSDPATADSSADGGPGAPGSGGGVIGAVRSEFGLDQRPANTTCLAPARPPPPGSVKLERAYGNVQVQRPMVMAQPPGDRTRWFVAQRDGVFVSFPSVSPPAQPARVANVAQLSDKPILQDFEGGFLGFAFHPKFADNGRIYVSFTTTGSAGGYASEVGYMC